MERRLRPELRWSPACRLAAVRAISTPTFPQRARCLLPGWNSPGSIPHPASQAGERLGFRPEEATGASDTRPLVTEGPDWGYHAEDVNLALGNLVADVASAESSLVHLWS